MNPFANAASQAVEKKKEAELERLKEKEDFMKNKVFSWYENIRNRYEVRDGKVYDLLRKCFIDDDQLIIKLNALNNMNVDIVGRLKFAAFNTAWGFRLLKENFDKLGLSYEDECFIRKMDDFYDDVYKLHIGGEYGQI